MIRDKTFIYDHRNLENLAKTLVSNYGNFKKWALYGQMGSGKTTLIKTMVKLLGSEDEGSSPTFTIVNQYKSVSNGFIYHIDLYRLKNEQEVFDAGIYEIIQSADYCFIEWPELIENWMDESWIKVELTTLDENIRSLSITPETISQ